MHATVLAMRSYGTAKNWLHSFIVGCCLPTLAASVLSFAGCSSDDGGGVYHGGSSGAGGQGGTGAKGGQSGSGGTGGSGQSGASGQAGSGGSGQTGDSGTCPEDPSDDPCALCRKISCCPALKACERDTECAKCEACLAGALPADCTQSGECSDQNAATATLLTCMEQSCVEC